MENGHQNNVKEKQLMEDVSVLMLLETDFLDKLGLKMQIKWHVVYNSQIIIYGKNVSFLFSVQ